MTCSYEVYVRSNTMHFPPARHVFGMCCMESGASINLFIASESKRVDFVKDLWHRELGMLVCSATNFTPECLAS